MNTCVGIDETYVVVDRPMDVVLVEHVDSSVRLPAVRVDDGLGEDVFIDHVE